MSSTIDYFFPKLQDNPILRFQYISERIIKVKSDFDMLTGLFFAYLEKIYQSDDNISMRQLKIACYLAVDLIKNKNSIRNELENRVFDFSKKICALMDNIEYLILYPSFLDKLDKITELKNEKKDIFALIPIVIIITELIKMKKRETSNQYKDYLEDAIKILIKKKEGNASSPKFSEFLKMVFTNIFEVELNFYNAADFIEKEKVKNKKILTFSPLNLNNPKKSINILFDEKYMHTLWENDIKVYEEARKTIERSFEERKPIQKLFDKVNRELKKNRRENGIFLSIVKKLLCITEKMLPDFSVERLNSDDVLNAFRSIRKYIKKNPGLFTAEMQNNFKNIRDQINKELSDTDNSGKETETVYSNEYDQVENESEEDISKMKKLNKIESPPPPPPLMILCPICEELRELSDIKTFDCDHKICRECAYGFLNAKYEGGDWTFDIPCFDGSCQNEYALKHPDSYYFLIDLIGKDKVDKMCDKLATDQINFKCANPNCNFNCTVIEDANQIKFVICPECDTQTCIKCKEEKHDGKVCTALLGKMLEALGNANENRLRVCPFCFEPYLKDQHCEHVTCLKCKNDWCFTCSVDRIPTLAHGNHYHRRDCKQFSVWTDQKNVEKLDEEFDVNKCERCRKNNAPCKRPATMKDFYASIGFPLKQEVAEEKAE